MEKNTSRKDLSARVEELRRQYGSELVILAHHYQSDGIVQHVDFSGDSLELARRIPEISARHIVFCGVFFMAESACLLARQGQKVYLPDHSAGCRMANMARAKDVERILSFLADAGRKTVPLAYVNSSLAVKAVVGKFGGAVCTSSNAVSMMEWAMQRADTVLFLPDQNLGQNTAKRLGLSEKQQFVIDIAGTTLDCPQSRDARLLLWPGFCPTHAVNMLPSHVENIRKKHPGCRILVHPECTPDVVDMVDGAGSTAFLIKEAEKAAQDGKEKKLCIGTEYHLVNRLAKRFSGTLDVLPLVKATCPNMEKVTLPKLLDTLEGIADGKNIVTVEENLKAPARETLVRMLDHCRQAKRPRP
ncbi:MAG: quinolinate synthase NadA [Mailhella sp.]|nr:quinolinate synthase NadA [Mailhella sp.]